MKITRLSPLTLRENTMDLDVTPEQLESYYEGDTLIQNAFPNLTPAEREFIKSGLTDSDWKALFGDEDE